MIPGAAVAEEVLEKVLEHPEIVAAVAEALTGGVSKDALLDAIKAETTRAVREQLESELGG